MSDSLAPSLSLIGDRNFGTWFESLVSSLRRSQITLAIIAVAVGVFFSGSLTSAWQLTPSDMTTAWWKLLSCHVTHWSFDQLFWDVLAFGVLGYLCEQTGRRRFIYLLLLSSLTVSLSVMGFHPELASYRGLSGVDSALFAYLACYVAEKGFRNRDRMCVLGGVVAWLVFVGKVTIEFYTGQTLFVESAGAFQSLPISHVAGAFAGSLVWLVAMVVSQSFCMTTRNRVSLHQ